MRLSHRKLLFHWQFWFYDLVIYPHKYDTIIRFILILSQGVIRYKGTEALKHEFSKLFIALYF